MQQVALECCRFVKEARHYPADAIDAVAASATRKALNQHSILRRMRREAALTARDGDE